MGNIGIPIPFRDPPRAALRQAYSWPFAEILGVPVGALTLDDLLQVMDRWITDRERHYICAVSVHPLVESQSAPDLREIYKAASVVIPDGMPLVWLLRRAGHAAADRICGPDLMPAMFDRSQRTGARHFLYGSTAKTLELLTANLRRQYPSARIVGSYSPPFRDLLPGEDVEIVDHINAANADIVWVGLGAPKQDRWMAAYRPKLDAPVLISVGAAFDMLAGKIRRPPRFIQRSGFEWVFRLMQDPRRLLRRYAKCNFLFALMLLQERLHLQRDRFPSER
jgi:N-acetylglucosaminyldiphosphoundecaprenol N-acetyl-beta-D-mannosaminyltransferase